jgi:hypothetical protein
MPRAINCTGTIAGIRHDCFSDMKNIFFLLMALHGAADSSFKGQYFSGNGDVRYLALLDSAYSLLEPNPRLENLSMLYKPDWNGFVEGPTWNAWWIQNSFGPTYTMLPFMDPAYQAFVFNSQAMWFNMQGNGVRKDNNGYTGPEGVLCDAATLRDVWYRQGDGKVSKHDWCFGFTTAGILLQSELMLIRRDKSEAAHYLPLLEKSADFVDSRRNRSNNMFLVGAAANLLAPSYAGTGEMLPDSSYGKAYLAEISVNYIAAMDRLIEVEKMMGRTDKVKLYQHRREQVRAGLKNFITPEGYFIRSIDEDGTRHGVYGAVKHGYFESTPNQDAMAFRVVSDAAAGRIYDQIRSIPQLRPYRLIIPNYPSYDDMYEYGGLFTYGRWVNGGEWATCEARMQMGYYRVGAYADAAAGFTRFLRLAGEFKMDNNLTDFGKSLYQPHLSVNCVYDCWGAPGGFLRGLFEYIYTAGGLVLYPHIPTGITTLKQRFPVYFGKKRIYLTTHGTGNITSVRVNGRPVSHFDPHSFFLKAEGDNPGIITVSFGLGGDPALAADSDAGEKGTGEKAAGEEAILSIPGGTDFWNIDALRDAGDTSSRLPSGYGSQLKKIGAFYRILINAGLEGTYACKHAELILRCVQAIDERRKLKQEGELPLLPVQSQIAADKLYITTVTNLTEGFEQYMGKCKTPSIAGYWQACTTGTP